MFGTVLSAGVLGIDAFAVSVEVDIQSAQLPKWNTVGLADSAVKESKDRVISAITNAGYEFLYRRITINLAPADLKKDGTAYDLPIALGLLVASEILDQSTLDDVMVVGELGLTGEVRGVSGVLPMVLMAREMGLKRFFVPFANQEEAAVVDDVDVYGFKHLGDVVEFLKGNTEHQIAKKPSVKKKSVQKTQMDMNEICGQYQAKRALEIAASGGHNLLLSGPPGTGKTMLASRLATILPDLNFEESLETSKIYSIAGLLQKKGELVYARPFRQPHHSISNSGMIGGGSIPRPGEVSLAHNGVLFLDELPEFQKHVLELLRQPLESDDVTISRASISLTFPARFILIASANPCPCGFLGHPKVQCRCTTIQIDRYKSKLSGPLLDRIDMKVEVPPVPYKDYRDQTQRGESSEVIAKRVEVVRDIQKNRYESQSIYLNSQMTPKLLRRYCQLDEAGDKILKSSVDKFQLSARAMSRILKIARTIADMDHCEAIKMDHILEAIQYRGVEA